MPLTAPELRALALAIWGHRWQGPLARALAVNPRTVRRWASGDVPVPDRVEEELRRVVGADKRNFPWPRDEWIVGDGMPDAQGRRREYLVHTLAPRFVARVVAVDDDGLPHPDEEPADLLSGIVWSSGDTVLCEITWIDPPPAMTELRALLEAAADALDADT